MTNTSWKKYLNQKFYRNDWAFFDKDYKIWMVLDRRDDCPDELLDAVLCALNCKYYDGLKGIAHIYSSRRHYVEADDALCIAIDYMGSTFDFSLGHGVMTLVTEYGLEPEKADKVVYDFANDLIQNFKNYIKDGAK